MRLLARGVDGSATSCQLQKIDMAEKHIRRLSHVAKYEGPSGPRGAPLDSPAGRQSAGGRVDESDPFVSLIQKGFATGTPTRTLLRHTSEVCLTRLRT